MNQIQGMIDSIESVDSIHLVRIRAGSTAIHCLTLDLDPRFVVGKEVVALYKETDVFLAKEFFGFISVENHLPAQVAYYKEGKILTEVVLQSGFGAFSAILTTRDFREMEIAQGDNLLALVKACAISLSEV